MLNKVVTGAIVGGNFCSPSNTNHNLKREEKKRRTGSICERNEIRVQKQTASLIRQKDLQHTDTHVRQKATFCIPVWARRREESQRRNLKSPFVFSLRSAARGCGSLDFYSSECMRHMFLQSSVDTLGRALFISLSLAAVIYFHRQRVPFFLCSPRASLFPHWVFATDFPSLARSATHFINHLFSRHDFQPRRQ
jgi:hypothetical protein